MIPPKQNAAPVVNMDEHPVQLVKETRLPVVTRPGKPERYNYEYERNETAVDWAQEIKELLDTDYREAETVVLVCDNLKTHTPAALYEAFSPEGARRLAKRLEIHNTPKHGSWLNIAEIVLSVLSNQCL